jgi:hypothetical protein
MPGIVNITGQHFGRLIAIQLAGSNSRGKALWQCDCACGNTCIVEGRLLRRSNGTRSCGCLVKEHRGPRPKHGHARAGKGHPIYQTWMGMRSRCNNSNNLSFKDYGGRGIEICARWNDFTNFLADMGERPPDKVLDRIDNDGNYEPGNVRWATYERSNKNKRRPKTTWGRSGLRGVRYYQRRWQARIGHNGESIYLGAFATAEEAHSAYCAAAKELHGEAAWNRIEADIFAAQHEGRVFGSPHLTK